MVSVEDDVFITHGHDGCQTPLRCDSLETHVPKLYDLYRGNVEVPCGDSPFVGRSRRQEKKAHREGSVFSGIATLMVTEIHPS